MCCTTRRRSLAAALRIVALLEFSSLLDEERPTRELLLAFSGEISRHAQRLALMAGGTSVALLAEGQAWFEKLTDERADLLQAAYYSLHAAAYLGLNGGMNTARVLSALGWALRVLAEGEERLTN
ncbi:hypothetical protein Q0M94_24095 (plasmid) [Deinococcus radiomollis]|uniref:hypothetical protein n=1 Tax=Deinococcus radiomollis TaxID=468916 RepID=UPI0038929BAC